MSDQHDEDPELTELIEAAVTRATKSYEGIRSPAIIERMKHNLRLGLRHHPDLRAMIDELRAGGPRLGKSGDQLREGIVVLDGKARGA